MWWLQKSNTVTEEPGSVSPASDIASVRPKSGSLCGFKAVRVTCAYLCPAVENLSSHGR